MAKTSRVTTNLSQNLFDFIAKEAKESGVTFRSVLEKAIKHYQKEKLKKQLMDGYNAMANNDEENNQWLEIANNPQNLTLEDDF